MTEIRLRPAFEAWVAEKSISLCPTSLASDYQQAIKWVHKSPFELVSEGRPLLGWTLKQDPQKAARRVATLIKAFYRWASSEDVQLVPFNPVASFKFPKAPQQNSEVVVIPKDEVPFMMAALERQSKRGAQWHHYAMFQLQTGLRTGEVRAVQVGDIKGDRLLVHQNFTITHGLKHSTKTNKRRWVPINPVARGILDELTPDADGFLFPWNRSTFMAFFHDRMQELHNLGLIGRVYRPYDLRHTAITRWLEAGVSVATCASWAGNTAEVIWKHYAGADETTLMPIL